MAGYELNESFSKFLDQAASHRLLSMREEQVLARKWRNEGDNSARHELFIHNVRLVVSIARNFTGRGLPLEDLVQAGMIGLDRATRKFDPERGYKASTYFSWWIRQSCQRALAAEGKTIRVPNQVSTRRLQIENYLKENSGASNEEIAERLECTVPQILRARMIAEVVLSLDQEQQSDTQFSVIDTLADPTSSDPYEAISESSYFIRTALAELPTLQRQVVALKHGFTEAGELTLQEISVLLDTPLREVQLAQKEGFARLRELLA